MQEKPTSKRRTDIWYQAQDVLSRRDHSEHELRVKLARKRFSESQIDEVVDRLKAQRLIDDERFAATYVRQTLRMKQVGPRWLVHKLREKRIPSEYIEPAVYDAFDDETEAARAGVAATNWKRSHAKHASDTERLLRFLLSRGFSSDAAREATYFEDA